jgi:hypothetical protein
VFFLYDRSMVLVFEFEFWYDDSIVFVVFLWYRCGIFIFILFSWC